MNDHRKDNCSANIRKAAELAVILRRLLAVCALICLVTMPSQKAAAATEAENTVFDWLTDQLNLSPAAACGIMGNIKAESNFISGISGLGGAYGLCQWGGGRLTRLRSFCASRGLDSSSIKGQMYFIEYELNNYYPKVYSYLKNVSNNASGAYQAGWYWCMYYEIPANRDYQGQRRGAIARDTYWPELGASRLYLTARAVAGGVKLSWPAGSKGKKILVKRSAKENGTYKTIATLSASATSYTDKSITKKKKFYYYVVPANKAGKELTRSNKVSFILARTLRDDGCSVKLKKKKFTYTGKKIEPKVVVKYDGVKLKLNQDYSVTYSANTNAGTGVATITGKGSYKGKVKRKFTIEKAAHTLKVWDLKTDLSEGSVIPKVEADADYRLIPADTSIARANGEKLLLKKCGRTTVKVRIPASKNYKRATATLTLTVLPATPEITGVKIRKNGKAVITWEMAGRARGYEVIFTDVKGFPKASTTRISLAKPKATGMTVELPRNSEQWRFRVRGWALTEDGEKLWGKWSKVYIAK